MRIAIFSEFFLPKIDGVVTRTLNTIKWLKQMGDEVLVFAANPGIREYCGAEIFRLPSIPCPPYPEYKMVFPLPIIESKLKEFNPDVVIVMCPVCLGLAGIYYTKKLGFPLVISHHTNWPLYLKFNGMTWLEKPTWKFLSYLYKQGTITATVSQSALNDLKNIGLQSPYLWSTGVNQHFLDSKSSEKMRTNMSQGDVKKPLMLFVGRLSKEKNIALINEIMKEIPEANLAIVGDGPQRNNLEKIFPTNRTKFMGYLQGEQLAESYASADVFVFPSEFETLGFVVIEAMASGCPVVACKAGGVQNVIINNQTGLLFNPGNISEAVTAIKTAIYNQEKSYLLTKNARKYANNLSWENATKRLKEILKTAIEVHQNNQ